MKRTLAFAASLLLLGACSSDGYTIRGKIAGLDNPYVYLLRYTGEVEVIDSAKVTMGDFVFKGKAEQPEVVYLSTDKQQPFVHFFLENGRISVDGALSAPADIAVLGTPSHDIQQTFDETIAALEEEYAKAGNDMQRDSQRKEYSKLMSDAVEMTRDKIYGVTTILNNAYAFLSPEEVMEQIALFPAEWQQRRELTELREATERKLRVSAGHPYIDIAAKNADGGEVSLKSVVENRRNKYVLLDFWASWCGPCMAEIPFLKADYEKYGKKGFEIYAVSFDSQRARWIDAVRQQGMKWIQVSGLSGFQTPAAEAYAVQSIPSNFLIRCSDGQIVATQLRGEALGEKLGELLGDCPQRNDGRPCAGPFTRTYTFYHETHLHIRSGPALPGCLHVGRLHDSRQRRGPGIALRLSDYLQRHAQRGRLGRSRSGRLPLRGQDRTARSGLSEPGQGAALRAVLPRKRPHLDRRQPLQSQRGLPDRNRGQRGDERLQRTDVQH